MSQSAMVCITFGLVAGVLARSFFALGAFFIGLCFLLAALFLIYSRFCLVNNRRIWLTSGLFLLALGAGILRYNLKDESSLASRVELSKREVILTGLVVAEPEARDTRAQVIFKPDSDEWSKIILSLPLYPEFNYGDRFEVTGKLARVKDFTTKDGQLIPYADYLAADEIYFQMFEPKVARLAVGEGSAVKATLFKFKKFLLARLGRALPEPEASLVAGLTLGARASLGVTATDDLRRAGLLHIVVLSGYNLSIVALVILFLLGRFSLRLRLSITALTITLFTLMVAAGPASLRALVMALIVLLAQATGRRAEAGRALITAGLFMIIVNPKVLVFDAGFQLSFLATAGLIYLAPQLTKYFRFVKWSWLREILTTTTSAQLAVLPWFLYRGLAISPLVLPANLLVLPVVPLAMLFGFLTIIFSPFGWIAWLIAHYILAVAHLIAKLV